MRQPSTSPGGPITRVPGMRSLLTMSALGFAGYALLLPVAPLWAVHGGAGSGGAGLVNAVLMLATVLTQTTMPAALRRIGWRPTMVAGMLLLGLPSALFVLTDSLPWLLVLSAVRGMGFAVLTVCGSSAVAALVDGPRHGRAIGVYGLSIAIPQLLLVPGSAWIAESLDFPVVFALGSLPVLGVPAAAVLGGRLERVTADDGGDTEPAAPDRARWRVLAGLVLPSLVLLAVTTPGGALLTFAPQFAGSAALAAVGLLGFTAATALSRWAVGGPADRYGPRVFLAPLLGLCAAGLGVCAWAIADGGTRGAALVLGMTVVGLSYGSLQNLTLVEAFAAVPHRSHPTASTVWNIGFDTGTGLGSLVVGFIAAGSSFAAGLATTAVVCVVAAGAVLLAGRSPARTGRTA
ncbi:putative MFS family arabinose efflux permease [Isoptericola sp. CG 20/1183]|uniref:MFS family arabinose efflux permease n=1 Tax=Isoptericola halotolerans TaxID=300560 RepID=A0ABX5EHC8_9MICO|nr:MULTISPECIES: MFS transporter [Isoptericola]PRZ02890.1 putative MFS family arabinose efflux permease [Isoptericola sp. CG 20/1183]PRZ09887.1 putative MFS family arabinose efflux permease [Isoptericola halotolerans]